MKYLTSAVSTFLILIALNTAFCDENVPASETELDAVAGSLERRLEKLSREIRKLQEHNIDAGFATDGRARLQRELDSAREFGPGSADRLVNIGLKIELLENKVENELLSAERLDYYYILMLVSGIVFICGFIMYTVINNYLGTKKISTFPEADPREE